MAKAGAVEVDIRANSAQFVRSMRKVERSTTKISRQLTSFARLAAIAGTAVAAAFTARQAKEILDFADNIDKLNQSLGVSEELLSAFRFSAEQSGGTFEQFAKGVARSQKTLQDARDGLLEARRGFDKLGLSVDALGTQDTDTQLLKIVAALGKIEDQAQRQSIAAAIFGRGSGQLFLQFASDIEGLKTTLAEAQGLGVVLGEDVADSAASINDSFNRVGTAIRGLFTPGEDSEWFSFISRGLENLTLNLVDTTRVTKEFREELENLDTIVIDSGNNYIRDSVADIEDATNALKVLSATTQEDIKAQEAFEIATIQNIANADIEELRRRKDAHDKFTDTVTQNFRIAQEDGFSGLVNSFKMALQEMVVELLASQVWKFFAGQFPGLSGGGGALGGIGKLFGFQTGGSFEVGGGGGRDSQLVAFRASPGETVSVNTPAQGSGGGVTIVQNNSFNGMTSADKVAVAGYVQQANKATEANIKNLIQRGRFV